MKTINFVFIAQQLTDDSEVHFFNTPLEAENYFNNEVKPLLVICLEEDLPEDEAYTANEKGNVIRFNLGYNRDLDEKLADTNKYYYWDSIEVEDDITHYFAQFSDWVDDSSIEFMTEKAAREQMSTLMDVQFNMADYTFRVAKIKIGE